MSWRIEVYENHTVIAPDDEWVMHDRLLWSRKNNGEPEYRCDCDCDPEITLDYDRLTIVHNAFDGRQALEWANEILNKK